MFARRGLGACPGTRNDWGYGGAVYQASVSAVIFIRLLWKRAVVFTLFVVIVRSSSAM